MSKLLVPMLMSLAFTGSVAAAPATFTFDDATPHASLPLSLTVDGITASLSATGSGFSIQAADVLGFTPAGFSGLSIYPNSVFAADLRIDFSTPLVDFSILYAPEEYATDSSARMRVTAFLGGVEVGTRTTTAPVPGTWPTGTLSFSSGAGFDSVVLHYDAPPPTGGDWGPIFMADDMVVTAAVPEPEPVELYLGGMLAIGFAVRRRMG